MTKANPALRVSFREIFVKYRGAVLTARRQYPEGDADVILTAALKVCQWHYENGTLEECTKTYRGDFYNPVPGSPEAGLYWGEYWESKPIAPEPGRPPLGAVTAKQIQKKYEVKGKVPSTATSAVLYTFEKKIETENKFHWQYCTSYELKRLSQSEHDRVLIDDTGKEHTLIFTDYYRSDYYGANKFFEALDELEGQPVFLCFKKFNELTPFVLVDVVRPYDLNGLEKQVLDLRTEKRRLDDSYKDSIEAVESHISDLKNNEESVRTEYQNRLAEIKGKKSQLAEELKEMKHQKMQKSKSFRQNFEDAIFKLATFIPAAKALEEKEATQENEQQAKPLGGVRKLPKNPDDAKVLDKWLDRIKGETTADQKINEDALPNPQVAILEAQLNEERAKREAAEEGNESRDREMALFKYVALMNTYHNQSEQEKTTLRNIIIEHEIAEMTDAERKQFHENCEVLKERLKDEFGKPLQMRLHHGHPKDMLALRAGINHQVNQLGVQLVELLDGNQYRVSLLNYNIDVIAALDFDKNHPGELMIKTVMHLGGEKWLKKEFEVTGYNMKFKKGIKLKQYLKWHRTISSDLHIEQYALIEKKGPEVSL